MFVSFAAQGTTRQMTSQTHRLLIGSLGWQHAGWQGNYYPEDLPADWRLGYYSNEFPLAVIEWTGQGELAEEVAECREDLVLLAAITPAADDPATALTPLHDWLVSLPREHGVLLRLDPAPVADPAGWLAAVREALGDIPCCLLPDGLLDARWRTALQQQQIGWSWNAHSDREGLAIGSLAVIEVDAQADARALRERIEAGLAVGGAQRHVALLFHGEPPSVEAMRQARTLEELM